MTEESEHLEVENPIEEKLENIRPLSQILDKGIPEMVWWVDKLIPKSGIVLLAGESGSYKTFAAMLMALSIEQGEPFLEQGFSTKKGIVLFIDEENGDYTIISRFDKLKRGHGLTERNDNLFISIFNNIKIQTFDFEAEETLKTLVNKYNPNVIFIDPAVACMVGDENKASDVRGIRQAIKPILKERDNIAFVIIHHTRKDSNISLNSIRGSSDFRGLADVVILVEKHEGGFILKNKKSKYIDVDAEPDVMVYVQKNSDGSIRFDYAGEVEEPSSIIERCEDVIRDWIKKEQLEGFISKNVREHATKHGFKRNCIYSALKNLVEKGILQKPAVGRYEVINTSILNNEVVPED